MWVDKLLEWYLINERNFYWRNNELNDFQWLALEILLRRSKAEKVNKICGTFFCKYKTPYDFILTPEIEISSDIKSIGYHRKRSIIFKEISYDIVYRFNGNVPGNFKDLCSIKHVGVYIASAFLTFHLRDINEPCIDTNVIRIMSRFFSIPVKNDNRSDTIVKAIVKNAAPYEKFREYNYALLDLGGILCLPKNPKCKQCPINNNCYYYLSEKLSM